MKFSALTSDELHGVLAAFDAIDAAYALLLQAGALHEDEEYDAGEIANAIADELTTRAMEDFGYRINTSVARGEFDRYMRPDGEIGYAPPGAWDELGKHQDSDWEL